MRAYALSTRSARRCSRGSDMAEEQAAMAGRNDDVVEVCEVGLRDGLQMVQDFLPTSAKLDWIRREHAAGLREIEVTSFVPPRLAPQFVDASEVVHAALALPGLTVVGLVPNLKGAERGVALQCAGDGRRSHAERSGRAGELGMVGHGRSTAHNLSRVLLCQDGRGPDGKAHQ